MTARLCKLSRTEIISSIGEIESVVRQPQFVCRSCARSAQQANRLCKPTALTPIPKAKQSTGEHASTSIVVVGKKERKREEKTNKKLKKIIKKQTKLLKKAAKLHRRFADYQSSLPATDSERSLINIH